MSSNQTVSARVASATPRPFRPFRALCRAAKDLLLSASLGFALLLGIGATPALAAPTLSMNSASGAISASTLQFDTAAHGTMLLGTVQPDNGSGGPTVI